MSVDIPAFQKAINEDVIPGRIIHKIIRLKESGGVFGFQD